MLRHAFPCYKISLYLVFILDSKFACVFLLLILYFLFQINYSFFLIKAYIIMLLAFFTIKNHAIRRADMERRVVETLYPTCNINNKRYSLWSWIVDKIWPSNDPVIKSDTYDSETILYPWHIMKSVDDLYILTRR